MVHHCADTYPYQSLSLPTVFCRLDPTPSGCVICLNVLLPYMVITLRACAKSYGRRPSHPYFNSGMFFSYRIFLRSYAVTVHFCAFLWLILIVRFDFSKDLALKKSSKSWKVDPSVFHKSQLCLLFIAPVDKILSFTVLKFTCEIDHQCIGTDRF